MQKDNTDDKLFDAMLKMAAENALEQEMKAMPSCEELNSQHKPSANFEKRIRKIIAQHNRKEKISVWKRVAVRISVSIILLMTVSTAILLSVEATRNYFFNAVIKWQEDHFSFGHSDNDTDGIYKPSYLPKGFTEFSSNITGDINRIVYQNEIGVKIIFRQYPSQSFNILADHEDKKFVDIKINAQEAYLFVATELEKSNILLWETNGTIFNLTSEIESVELILIAESIKK